MATETMNVSLPAELKAAIESRVRSGNYGNASDVIRAGLRALAREELGSSVAEFEKIVAALPSEPLNAEIEQQIEAELRQFRKPRRKFHS